MTVSNCPSFHRRVLATVRAGHATYPEILQAMGLPVERRTLTVLSRAVSFYCSRGEIRRTYHNLGSVRTVTVEPVRRGWQPPRRIAWPADRGEGRDD